MSERMLLPTTVVGSYPQPDWLIDRENLAKRPPPRGHIRFGSRDCAQEWRCARPNGRATAPLDSPDKSTPPVIPSRTADPPRRRMPQP